MARVVEVVYYRTEDGATFPTREEALAYDDECIMKSLYDSSPVFCDDGVASYKDVIDWMMGHQDVSERMMAIAQMKLKKR